MKKILSVILAVLMLIGSVSFQAAAYERPEPPYIWHIIEIEEIVEEVRSAFKDLILQSLHHDADFNEDFMETEVYATQDEAIIFFGSYGDMNYSGTQQLIGQYAFFGRDVVSYDASGNNPIGLYVLKNDGTVVSLMTAYEEGIVDIADFAALYPKHTKLSDREYDIITKLGLSKKSYHYEEHFLICRDEEGATPDYVLVEAAEIIWKNGVYTEKVGDFVIRSKINYIKDALPYFVYLGSGELLTIKEAVARGVHIIEDAILPSDIPCALIGDCDGDGAVTVKDATHIQKKLVGFYLRGVYDDYLEAAVEDFDNDQSLTIRDATAIQKKLAGIK